LPSAWPEELNEATTMYACSKEEAPAQFLTHSARPTRSFARGSLSLTAVCGDETTRVPLMASGSLRVMEYARLVRGLDHPISGRRIQQAIGLSMQ
jgi:hypothetical protein